MNESELQYVVRFTINRSLSFDPLCTLGFDCYTITFKIAFHHSNTITAMLHNVDSIEREYTQVLVLKVLYKYNFHLTQRVITSQAYTVSPSEHFM